MMEPMPTSNPALSEKVFDREMESAGRGGFAPRTFTGSGGPGRPHRPDSVTTGGNGPVAGSVDDAMRVSGVASATAVLGAVLLIAGFVGWHAVAIETATTATGERVVTATHIPGWLWPAWIVGLILAVATVFKPKIARVTAVLYAIAEGLLLGAISKIFDVRYQGIVLQAIELTGAVFVIMWVLFATGTIKVTDKLRTGIIVATGAMFVIYAFSWILSLLGVSTSMLFDGGVVGIGFSLAVVGIAAFNLLLDFDFVRRAVDATAPRYMEWYAAFGLMVTLVWLYLELLRLLAQLRN